MSERAGERETHGGADEERLRRWQAATEWPLTAVALVFLVAYAVPVAFPDAPPGVRAGCSWLLGLTWVVFVADYLVRVVLSRRSWDYVRRHPLELAVVVLPVLRPLLLISVVTRLNRVGVQRMRGQVVRYAVAGTALLVLTGALAITQAERGAPGASIQNLGDGFWWTMVTITTVGYGDMAPVSTQGRLIAACLMLGGIALLGVVTATLSSWLVQLVSEESEDREPGEEAPSLADVARGAVAPPQQVAELLAEVQALRAELAESRDRGGQGPPAGSQG